MTIGDNFSISFWIKIKSYTDEGIITSFTVKDNPIPNDFYITTMLNPKKGIGIFYKFKEGATEYLNSYFYETR